MNRATARPATTRPATTRSAKTRSATALLTAGAATAAIGAGLAVAGPALAGSAAPVMIEHIVAKSTSNTVVSKTSYVLTDEDFGHSKQIGRDVLYCTDFGNGVSRCHVAFSQNGGMIYGSFTLTNSTGALAGAVTGGTNDFTGAHGQLTGQAVSATQVQVTLRFRK